MFVCLLSWASRMREYQDHSGTFVLWIIVRELRACAKLKT